MGKYFEVKVKCDRIQENGILKRVTESYLVDAMSFTEAEQRITKELSSSKDLEVAAIAKTKISELVKPDGDFSQKWYRCKLIFSEIDENSGKEKKTAIYYLVQSTDLNEAKNKMVEFMKGSVQDYEFSEIKETPILEVYEAKRECPSL